MKWILFFLLSFLLHEAGHIVACLLLGVRVTRVGVEWKGPYIAHECGTDAQYLLIALAGPGANLLLAVLFWSQPLSGATFGSINLIVGLTNLLPIRDSDGSHIWDALKRVLSS